MMSVHLAAHSGPQRLAHSERTTSFSALLRSATSASDGVTSLSLAGGPIEQGPLPVLQAMPSVLSFSTIAQDCSSSFLNSARMNSWVGLESLLKLLRFITQMPAVKPTGSVSSVFTTSGHLA